jgi:sterol 3beta-glucosyltransferase
VPALVIPHIADQFYWGRQVYELGAGPEPIRRTKLDITRLTAAVDDLVRNVTLRARASDLGQQIRSEAGVESAVQLIEATFS